MNNEVTRLIESLDASSATTTCVTHRYLYEGRTKTELIEVARADGLKWIVTTPDVYADLLRLPVKPGTTLALQRLLVVTEPLYADFARARSTGVIEYDIDAASDTYKFIQISGTVYGHRAGSASIPAVPTDFEPDTIAAVTGMSIAEVSKTPSVWKQIWEGAQFVKDVAGAGAVFWQFAVMFDFAMKHSNYAFPFIGAARAGAIPAWYYIAGAPTGKAGLIMALKFGGALLFAAGVGVAIGTLMDKGFTKIAGKPLGVWLYDTIEESSTSQPGGHGKVTVLGAEDTWVAREHERGEAVEMVRYRVSVYVRLSDGKWMHASDTVTELAVDQDGKPVEWAGPTPPAPDVDDSSDGEESDEDEGTGDPDEPLDDDTGRPATDSVGDTPSWIEELERRARRASVQKHRWRRLAPLIHVNPDDEGGTGGPIKTEVGSGPDPAPDLHSHTPPKPVTELVKPRPGGPDPAPDVEHGHGSPRPIPTGPDPTIARIGGSVIGAPGRPGRPFGGLAGGGATGLGKNELRSMVERIAEERASQASSIEEAERIKARVYAEHGLQYRRRRDPR